MGNMKKANYIISVIMLLIGVGIVALASSLKIKLGEGDPGAGFWPMMLGVLIIVFCMSVVLKQSKTKKNLKQKHFTIATLANIRVYILFGIIILLSDPLFSRILCRCNCCSFRQQCIYRSSKCKEDCTDNSDRYIGGDLCSVWYVAEHYSAGTDIYEIRRKKNV